MADKVFDDKVLEGMSKKFKTVSQEISKRYKGKQPFATIKVPKAQRIADYQALTPQDIVAMIKEYGVDAVDEFIYEHEQLKAGKRI